MSRGLSGALVSPVITAHPTETRRRTVFDTQNHITRLMRMRLHGLSETEDGQAIETELRRLTEEIERMEGRAKFLRDQVAMATLDIEFRAVAEAPPPPPHRRQPSRFSWINLVGASNLMERF